MSAPLLEVSGLTVRHRRDLIVDGETGVLFAPLALGPLGGLAYFPAKFKLRVLDPVHFDLPPDLLELLAELDTFIANPDQVVGGNKMKPFTGISDEAQRKDIIAFLKSISGT